MLGWMQRPLPDGRPPRQVWQNLVRVDEVLLLTHIVAGAACSVTANASQ